MESLLSPVFGEFFGTMVLILFGDGVVAAASLKDSKAQGSGWTHITWGWAWAVAFGVFAAQATGAPQADINPAVTLAKWLGGVYPSLGLVLSIMAAQVAGGFAGAALVYLTYLNHWEGTDPTSQLGVFSTIPARRNMPCNFLTEFIATFFLIVGIMCIFSKGVAAGGPLPTGLGPISVGALIYVLGAALGGPTGYAMNPARDLGPRLAHAFLPIPGKGDSDWGYAWVPILGPLAGGAVAFFVCRALTLM